MCDAATVEVLSFNGLGAADGCTNTVKLPITGVSLFNTIGGTLPECVWHLRNLTTLHLTGNGLTGTIISRLPDHSVIGDLSLSHNQFSGTIPPNMQVVRRVDLSHNQFSGGYENSVGVWRNNVVDLEINRLSGHLPVSKLELERDVNVLKGNMFSCDSIPANDEFSDDYICGSEDLNESLLVLGSALTVTCGVAILWLVAATVTPSSARAIGPCSFVHERMSELYKCMTAVDRISSVVDWTVQPIDVLRQKFIEVRRLFVRLLCVVLIVGVPVYLLRGIDVEAEFSTHSNTYAWFWTLAYTHGVEPSCLILASWFVTVTICFHRIVLAPLLEESPENEETQGTGPISSLAISESSCGDGDDDVPKSYATGSVKVRVGIVAALLTNGAITITVNALYIYATQQHLSGAILFSIQLCLAVFRLAYSRGAFPVLSLPIVDPIANIRFRLRLLVVNTLIIPCVVTAFASPSCFQVSFTFYIFSLSSCSVDVYLAYRA